jgi:hypothetical protein
MAMLQELPPPAPARRGTATDRIVVVNRLTLVEDLVHHELERCFVLEKQASVRQAAQQMGWGYDSLVRCVRGVQPFPAGRLPALCVATQSLRFLEVLVRTLGRHIAEIPGLPRMPLPTRPPLLVVTELLAICGRLAQAIRLVAADEDEIQVPLDPDNLREINNAIDEAHALLEILRTVMNSAGKPSQRPRGEHQHDEGTT